MDRRFLLIAVLLLLGVAANVTPIRAGLMLRLGEVEQLGRSAPVAFVVMCAALTAVAVPGAVLSTAGGFIFGPLQGATLTALGTTAGAFLLFFGGRQSRCHVLPDPGFWTILLARMSPVVPFAPVAYGAGLTRMTWSRFGAAAGLGAPPCAWLYATLGASALSWPTTSAAWIAHATGLAATIGALWLLSSALRKHAGTLSSRKPS